MIRDVRTLSLALAGLAGLTAGAQALPMSPEECSRVEAEQRGLESAGVTRDMAQGADWARTNLGPERLQRVARWIELQEQILFRCPRPKPVEQPKDATAAKSPAEDQSKKNQKPAKKPNAQPVSPPDKAAAPAPAKPPKPKPPAVAKPKPDDAYRPPAPFSGQELQHATPGYSVPPAGATTLAP